MKKREKDLTVSNIVLLMIMCTMHANICSTLI